MPTAPKPKALFNWSGGKDSSICLHKMLQSGEYDISFLFTTLNARYNRISQHGVRAELLERQAENIGLPLRKLYLPDVPTMENYNRAMSEALKEYKKEGVNFSVFGDIFLEDLRQYREDRLAELDYEAVFPLWGHSTEKLALEFIKSGFKAVAVCIDGKHLGRNFAGREFDESFLADLPQDIDPCGENGEFHTFVYDGPVFNTPVEFERGDIVYRTYTPPDRGGNEKDEESSDYICGTDQVDSSETGFWYCDLLPD